MYMIAEVSQYVAVASFTEAWIEISLQNYSITVNRTSPPSRRRGLKLRWHCIGNMGIRRLLHGGVDWNYAVYKGVEFKIVASFTEAWIEILLPCWRLRLPPRRLLHGGVDWNVINGGIRFNSRGRLLHGGVDWNRKMRSSTNTPHRSPPSRRRGLK